MQNGATAQTVPKARPNTFFGRFLVERGVISEEALNEALLFQEESNRRIGALAVERGFMTESQARAVIREQALRDKPFGSLALERGWLTEEGLDELLFAQTVHSSHLGEALLHLGHLTPEAFGGYLKEFKEQEQDRTDALRVRMARFGQVDLFETILDALSKGVRRMLEQNLKVDAVCEDLDQWNFGNRTVLGLYLEGKGWLYVELLLTDEIALRIGTGAGGIGAVVDCGDTCDKRVGEFHEIVARYMAANLEERGVAVTRFELGKAGPATQDCEQGGEAGEPASFLLSVPGSIIGLRVALGFPGAGGRC